MELLPLESRHRCDLIVPSLVSITSVPCCNMAWHWAVTLRASRKGREFPPLAAFASKLGNASETTAMDSLVECWSAPAVSRASEVLHDRTFVAEACGV